MRGNLTRRVVYSTGAALLLVWAGTSGWAHDLVIEGNVIARNGLGIYMGWYGDWDVRVAGNVIEGNGEGVRIVTPRAVLDGNVFIRNVVGIRVTEEHEERIVATLQAVVLRQNSFIANELYAVQNLAEVKLLADANWWGSPRGPRRPGDPAPVTREWVVYAWTLPALFPSCPLSLRLSFSACAVVWGLGTDFSWPTWTHSAWTWWDSVRWGLAPGLGMLSFLVMVREVTDPATGNYVAGALEYETWLEAPPGQGD